MNPAVAVGHGSTYRSFIYFYFYFGLGDGTYILRLQFRFFCLFPVVLYMWSRKIYL